MEQNNRRHFLRDSGLLIGGLFITAPLTAFAQQQMPPGTNPGPAPAAPLPNSQTPNPLTPQTPQGERPPGFYQTGYYQPDYYQ